MDIYYENETSFRCFFAPTVKGLCRNIIRTVWIFLYVPFICDFHSYVNSNICVFIFFMVPDVINWDPWDQHIFISVQIYKVDFNDTCPRLLNLSNVCIVPQIRCKWFSEEIQIAHLTYVLPIWNTLSKYTHTHLDHCCKCFLALSTLPSYYTKMLSQDTNAIKCLTWVEIQSKLTRLMPLNNVWSSSVLLAMPRYKTIIIFLYTISYYVMHHIWPSCSPVYWLISYLITTYRFG